MAKAKKGNKFYNRSKNQKERIEMLNNSHTLCKSNVADSFYSRLKVDKRLDRFIAVLEVCSIQNMTVDETCEMVYKTFPSYIKEGDFDGKVLNLLSERYSDISIALGYGPIGDDISNRMILKRARDISMGEASGNMRDIKDYISVYKEISSLDKENSDESSSSSKQTVTFTINK